MPRNLTESQLVDACAAMYREATAQVDDLQKSLATAERQVEIAARTTRAATANEAISDLVKQAQVTAAVATMSDDSLMGRMVRGFRLENFTAVRKHAHALAANQGTPPPTDREIVAAMQKARRDPDGGGRFAKLDPRLSGSTSRQLPGGFQQAGG
jgi:hypothetical protein